VPNVLPRISIKRSRIAAVGVSLTALLSIVPLVISNAKAQAGSTPVEFTSVQLEGKFLEQINVVRRSVGLDELAADPFLIESGRTWADSMRTAAAINHDPSLKYAYPQSWLRLGENVGTGPDVESIAAAFLASPSHYANIVRPDWDGAGIGVVSIGTRIYVVERFVDRGPSRRTVNMTFAFRG
jgi:uncharacterized protein YkwD